MKQKILTETELKFRLVEIYKEEQIKLLEQRWNNLLPYEKKFIFEFVKEFLPKNSKVLKEARWWNTLGDIVGIFDPTGIVDIINGLDYFRQGDTLFGIMSLISALPIIGDAVGKSVIGILKGGGKLATLMRLAKNPLAWARLGGKSSIIYKLLKSISSIGGKLISVVKRVPGGGKFIKVIEGWISMLTKASKISNTTRLTSKAAKMTSTEFKLFREFGLDSFTGLKKMWKKGGLFKNRQLSRQLYKSKFWLGFLDFVGLGNFVGPEELESKLGKDDFNTEMDNYMKTSEADKNWKDDLSGFENEKQIPISEPTAQTQQTTQPEKKSTGDVIGDILNIIGGAKTIGGLI
jgi:hypothetical protein